MHPLYYAHLDVPQVVQSGSQSIEMAVLEKGKRLKVWVGGGGGDIVLCSTIYTSTSVLDVASWQLFTVFIGWRAHALFHLSFSGSF